MKKIFILIMMSIILPAFADVAPYYTDSIPASAIGVYQTDKDLTLYKSPDKNTEIIKTMEFSYKKESMQENNFALLINEKQLGFLYVTDIDEDGWVEIIYDRKNDLRGWVQTADRMQFLPWMNFYNLYGRKYGLRFLKDVPSDMYILYSKSEDASQSVSKLNYVQQMKLSKISGNWALVSVMDLDKTPKTGWLKWRDSEGKIYAVPNIK